MERSLRRLIAPCVRSSRHASVVSTSSTDKSSHDTSGLKNIKSIPGPSGLQALPYIGSAFLFHPFTNFRLDQINLFFKNLHKEYGKIVKFRKGSKWAVFLYDPDLIEKTIRNEGQYPERPSMPLMDVFSKRSRSPLGISQLKGPDWYAIRKPLQDSAMKPRIVSEYVTSQAHAADDLVSSINAQLPHVQDITQLLFRYSAESTAIVCFNSRLGFLDDQNTPMTSELQDLLINLRQFLLLVAESYYTFPVFKLFPNKLYRRFVTITTSVRQTARRHVDRFHAELKEREAQGNLDPNEPNLLLALLVKHKVPVQTCLPLLSGFFFATENVARTLCLCLWFLAKNLDKQEAVVKEINSQCDTREITASSLAYLPYLKACVKETFRMAFPSPNGSVRILPKDLELAGYLIPKGTEVHFCHNTLSMSPEYFDSPEVYQPERWLREDISLSMKKAQSIIVQPFGFGARNCPGRRIAEQQIHLALVKLLQSFKVSLPEPDEELELIYNITATKKTPLELQFEKR